MTEAQLAWYVARIAGLGAFFVLTLAMLTGPAIRVGYLGALSRNRSLIAVHGFLTWFWVPLVLVHIVALLLDPTAHVGLADGFSAFRVDYAAGAALAIGLGTCGLWLLVIVGVWAARRDRMPAATWRWLHRLTYPMFVLFLLHAQLSGTDFAHTAVSAVAWAAAGAVVMLSVPRLFGARVAARRDATD